VARYPSTIRKLPVFLISKPFATYPANLCLLQTSGAERCWDLIHIILSSVFAQIKEFLCDEEQIVGECRGPASDKVSVPGPGLHSSSNEKEKDSNCGDVTKSQSFRSPSLSAVLVGLKRLPIIKMRLVGTF
jgi:hypothetical protein